MMIAQPNNESNVTFSAAFEVHLLIKISRNFKDKHKYTMSF